MKKIILLTVMFMFMLRSGHCQCSNASTAFKTNLITLLDLLTKNAPLRDGFYQASVGKKPDQVFGVLHCKANISKTDCANCLRYPMAVWDSCPENEKETATESCTMKFSYLNFIGSWSNMTISSYGNNGLDEPWVFSKGVSMMQGLASTAPDQPLMYQAAEIDVGVDGKRYGLAQCGRDLSKLSCQNCLEDRLAKRGSYAQNRTGWEILGTGCSMWYYTNMSDFLTPSYDELPPNVISGAQKLYGEIGITTIISMASVLLLQYFK